MAETLYAVYRDPNRARTVCDELINKGVRPEEISLLVKDQNAIRRGEGGVMLEDTRPTTPMRGTEFRQLDPMGDDMRQLSVPNIDQPLDAELNPAQSDYPGSPRPDASAMSSAPPEAERDYNPGLETDDYNENYEKDRTEATPYEDLPERSLRFSRGYNAVGENSPAPLNVDPDADAYRDADLHHGPGTAHDAAHGATQGAAIGLGVGAAAALVSLLIPGLGLVIGGGALATAAAALAAGTGVGAIAGGLAGWLQENGMNGDSAKRYGEAYDGGAAILAVTLSRPEMTEIVKDLLKSSGALEVETHSAYLA